MLYKETIYDIYKTIYDIGLCYTKKPYKKPYMGTVRVYSPPPRVRRVSPEVQTCSTKYQKRCPIGI
jgi:hypothetical protein